MLRHQVLRALQDQASAQFSNVLPMSVVDPRRAFGLAKAGGRLSALAAVGSLYKQCLLCNLERPFEI